LINHEGKAVREFRKASNKSGSSIENRLDGGELKLTEAIRRELQWSILEQTKAWTIVVMVDVETELQIALRRRRW